MFVSRSLRSSHHRSVCRLLRCPHSCSACISESASFVPFLVDSQYIDAFTVPNLPNVRYTCCIPACRSCALVSRADMNANGWATTSMNVWTTKCDECGIEIEATRTEAKTDSPES